MLKQRIEQLERLAKSTMRRLYIIDKADSSDWSGEVKRLKASILKKTILIIEDVEA